MRQVSTVPKDSNRQDANEAERDTADEYRVRASGVSRIFPAGRGFVHALDNVSLEVAPREFIALLGPSGCGKSTLLRLLAGLDRPTLGRLEVNLGGELRSPTPQDSAFVFQQSALLPWRTVIHNVAFPMAMTGGRRKEREAIAREWLERVGLQGFERQFPSQLSGGMQQRASIARAFASRREVLLMDEPFGALDAQTRMLMQEQLLDLWETERKTVLFVTHSIDEALLLSDRVVMMSARPGRIREVIDIPFERPRSFASTLATEFNDLKVHLWEILKEEVLATSRPEGK